MRALGLSPTRDLRPSFGTLGDLVLVILNVHITEVDRKACFEWQSLQFILAGKARQEDLLPPWQSKHRRR